MIAIVIAIMTVIISLIGESNTIVFFLFLSYDFLEIINDRNQKFGKYCGRQTGKAIVVTGDYALLILQSDGWGQYKGFQLFFTAVPPRKSLVKMLLNVR